MNKSTLLFQMDAFIKEFVEFRELIKQDKDLYYIAIGAMQETAYNKQLDYDLLGIESTKRFSEIISKSNTIYLSIFLTLYYFLLSLSPTAPPGCTSANCSF